MRVEVITGCDHLAGGPTAAWPTGWSLPATTSSEGRVLTSHRAISNGAGGPESWEIEAPEWHLKHMDPIRHYRGTTFDITGCDLKRDRRDVGRWPYLRAAVSNRSIV